MLDHSSESSALIDEVAPRVAPRRRAATTSARERDAAMDAPRRPADLLIKAETAQREMRSMVHQMREAPRRRFSWQACEPPRKSSVSPDQWVF